MPNPSFEPTRYGRRLSSNVNAAGLRTALRRCDLGGERLLVAELRHSNGGIYAATTGYSFSRNTSVERSVPPFTAASAVGDSAH